MNATAALALRRAALAGTAIGAALGAHLLAGDGMSATLATPLAWAILTLLATLVGARRRWRARGALGTAGLLVALQPLIHAAVGLAPWLFGLSVHHTEPLLAPTMLVAHGVAVAIAALAIARLERALEGALRVVRRVVAAVRPPQRTRPQPLLSHAALPRFVPRNSHRASIHQRGPPRPLWTAQPGGSRWVPPVRKG